MTIKDFNRMHKGDGIKASFTGFSQAFTNRPATRTYKVEMVVNNFRSCTVGGIGDSYQTLEEVSDAINEGRVIL